VALVVGSLLARFLQPFVIFKEALADRQR